MKKNIYLIIMIVSLILIFVGLYFIIGKKELDANSTEVPVTADPDQSGYLNELNANLKEEHCTDRICTTIRGMAKNSIATEFVVEITNKTSEPIGPGGIKLVSNDDESKFTIYFYNGIQPSQTIVEMCQHRLDDYEKMSDYHITELTDEEYNQEMSNVQ